MLFTNVHRKQLQEVGFTRLAGVIRDGVRAV